MKSTDYSWYPESGYFMQDGPYLVHYADGKMTYYIWDWEKLAYRKVGK